MTTRQFLIRVLLPVLTAAAVVQEAIDRTPERRLEREASHLGGGEQIGPIIEKTGMLMMGGLRTLAIDYLWIRFSDLKGEHQWLEAVQIAQLLTGLQPRNEEVWSYLVHDLVYNIPSNIESTQEKWKYVKKGILMGEEGVRRNPLSPFIRFNLGFTLYHRLQQDKALAELYRQERGRNPFAEARAWFEASRRALADWKRREGPDADYYAPTGIRVSDDTLSSFIRNVSLQDAGWTLMTGGGSLQAARKAREALGRSLLEVRRQLAQAPDLFVQRYLATCEDLVRAFDLEIEAEALAKTKGRTDPAVIRKLEEAWSAFRQAVFDPGNPNQPFRRRLDILEDTFVVPHWVRLGLRIGGDLWEPNDEGPFWKVIDFKQSFFPASFAPFPDDLDRCSFHAQAVGRARFTIRYAEGRLRPVFRLAAYGEGDSRRGWKEKGDLVPARVERGADPEHPDVERLVIETPVLEAGGEYLLELRNDPDGPWSKKPYLVTPEFLPE